MTLMVTTELIEALREKRTMMCLNCGYEHNCKVGRCELMQQAADALEAQIIAPESKPLTLEQLRQMNGKPVWAQFPGFGTYGFVAYNGNNIFITNNRGGCSTFDEILSLGGTIYARKPEGSAP